MIDLVEFLVGQQYENRKGVYEVIEIRGDSMRIRWENGEEVDTTVTMQQRIIEGMQRDLEQVAHDKVSSPIRKSATPKGWYRA